MPLKTSFPGPAEFRLAVLTLTCAGVVTVKPTCAEGKPCTTVAFHVVAAVPGTKLTEMLVSLFTTGT